MPCCNSATAIRSTPGPSPTTTSTAAATTRSRPSTPRTRGASRRRVGGSSPGWRTLPRLTRITALPPPRTPTRSSRLWRTRFLPRTGPEPRTPSLREKAGVRDAALGSRRNYRARRAECPSYFCRSPSIPFPADCFGPLEMGDRIPPISMTLSLSRRDRGIRSAFCRSPVTGHTAKTAGKTGVFGRACLSYSTGSSD